MKNVVVDHLSRLTDVESDDVPVDDYFPYDRLVAFVSAAGENSAGFKCSWSLWTTI